MLLLDKGQGVPIYNDVTMKQQNILTEELARHIKRDREKRCLSKTEYNDGQSRAANRETDGF